MFVQCCLSADIIPVSMWQLMSQTVIFPSIACHLMPLSLPLPLEQIALPLVHPALICNAWHVPRAMRQQANRCVQFRAVFLKPPIQMMQLKPET